VARSHDMCILLFKSGTGRRAATAHDVLGIHVYMTRDLQKRPSFLANPLPSRSRPIYRSMRWRSERRTTREHNSYYSIRQEKDGLLDPHLQDLQLTSPSKTIPCACHTPQNTSLVPIPGCLPSLLLTRSTPRQPTRTSSASRLFRRRRMNRPSC
jgi:hypothetical protein